MSVNIYMLHINSGSEGLQSVVIETVQRCHQSQIFSYALRQRLRECVVLHCKRHVMAEQVERLQLLFLIRRIALATSQGNCANQFSSDSQRSDTAKQFRGNISIRAEKSVIRRFREQD